MAALLAWASALLPLGYLALAADYGATFLLRRRPEGRSPLVPALVGVHALFLVLWGVALGRPPITTTAEVLSVLAAAMAAVYAWVELATRDRRTGLFILTLAFLFQYASTVLSARHPLAPSAGVAAPAGPSAAVHLWGALHVVLALVAYTALGFAGVYGGLYLTARRNLRRHRFGVLFDRLPPRPGTPWPRASWR